MQGQELQQYIQLIPNTGIPALLLWPIFFFYASLLKVWSIQLEKSHICSRSFGERQRYPYIQMRRSFPRLVRRPGHS